MTNPSRGRALPVDFSEFMADGAPDRRRVLQAFGASLGLAAVSACSRGPDPRAMPYVRSPEGRILGEAVLYASAVTYEGYAQPILGRTHEGRPTKLEGLPGHPASQGASDALTQAALYDLYDPVRSSGPLRDGVPASWSAFDTAMREVAERLDRKGGEGFRLLIGPTSSPTLRRQILDQKTKWPGMRVHVLEPPHAVAARRATTVAVGRSADLLPRLDRCDTIICLDADPLGPGPMQTALSGEWARRREAWRAGGGALRLLVAEPTPTLTGAQSEDRLASDPLEMDRLAAGLAGRFGLGPGVGSVHARERAWLDGAESALRAGRGRAVVLAGNALSEDSRRLLLALNQTIGAFGTTLSALEPVRFGGEGTLADLISDLEAGEVDSLAILEANPAYASPTADQFAAALARARVAVHAGLHVDETAVLCRWHAPVEHDLETWSDARAVDGRPSFIQPLVQPFHSVRSRHALFEALAGRSPTSARDLVAGTWKDRPDRAADLGVGWLDEPAAELSVSVSRASVTVNSTTPSEPVLRVIVRPDPSIGDGARSNNAWLQELPRPFTKVTWENIIATPPAIARREGLRDGDRIRIETTAGALEGPVWIQPGQARTVLVAYTGFGRTARGLLSQGLGYNAWPIASAIEGVAVESLRKTGRVAEIACTQLTRDSGDARPVQTRPRSATATATVPSPAPTFYAGKPQSSPQWGMAIDLDACIGCNACVIACMAENNVPTVGRDQVRMGREMHWLRVDHYVEGPEDDPVFHHQPLPCMHCEQAPCEMGCPVNATVHSADGLNLQVYNRCIGTRTCSAYCPYKVRRFNWFELNADAPPELQAARNPEVSVRARGVMEKCTFCIQRISHARIDAKVEGRSMADGDVVTACQQACPTNAIAFGDISDPGSRVSQLKRQARDYTLLEEANTRPRTSYLARLREGDDDDQG